MLSQVEAALAAAGDNEELCKLKTDLQELIGLTEQSLLSHMKSKLLQQLDSSGAAAAGLQPDQQPPSCHGAAKQSSSKAQKCSLYDSDDSSSSEDEGSSNQRAATAATTEHDLHQIIGTKCRAPHSHAWGGMTYHNAMIVAVEPLSETSEPQVRVLFTQPTHRSLVPCQFFLDDRCSFGDQCKYSHGHTVGVESLREYEEADHGSLVLGSKCLAKHEDGVWCAATVVEVSEVSENHTFKVMLDSDHSVHTVDIAHVAPLGSSCNSPSSDDDNAGVDDDEGSLHASDVDEDDALPVYLWRPGQCNDKMADWEKHTKGIGSMLMRRHGYIMGQGLGKHQEGRAEPVPIQLYPPGKSLDKIMELKERAGDRDLYDVMKKQKRRQKKVDAKAKSSYQKEQTNVFDFINSKLGHKKADVHNQLKGKTGKQNKDDKSKSTKHISHKDLKSKSEKSLNIQLFQTAEEMRNTEKEIRRLKDTIARNKGEPLVVKKMQEKQTTLERYLQQLRSSESSIQSHKNSRRHNKKLAIF